MILSQSQAADTLTQIGQLAARLHTLEPALRHQATGTGPDGYRAVRRCSVEGCGKILEARGWCSMHYKRWQKHGSIADPARSPTPAPIIDTDGCWIWQGRLSRLGYGQTWSDGRHREVHIVVYELFIGPIPEGLELDHTCRKRACVRPDHLEPVTHRENTLRGDGPTAQNARKTHCHRGHPFDETNTIRLPDGRRECRACRRARNRRRAQERRMARQAARVR